MSKEPEKLNIYQKLTAVRLTIQDEKIKKTGYNETDKYAYYELSDFLPMANTLFEKSGLFAGVSFTATDAVLTVTDMEAPDSTITFTAPMPKITGDVKNTGKAMSYVRRYLYLHCLELVEQDQVDRGKGKEKKTDVMERFEDPQEVTE